VWTRYDPESRKMTNQPRPTGVLGPFLQMCIRVVWPMILLLAATGRLDYWQAYLYGAINLVVIVVSAGLPH